MKKFVTLLLLFFTVYFLQAEKLFQKDKIMHFSSSAFVTYWNYGFSRDILHNSKNESYVFAISITGSLGVGKEFSDKYLKKTRFNWKDLAFDLGGIAVGIILINNLR